MNRRREVLADLADSLIERQGRHPLRVAVDGITASGKTTLADELSAEVLRRHRPVIRIRMDDFHHHRQHRYRQGKDSARGYYDDAYDFDALHRHVLRPLGPEGDRWFRRRIIDLESDAPIHESPEEAAADGIVIIDGSFMQRHHRIDWDMVVFVNTSFNEALSRGIKRDSEQLGGSVAAERRYRQRYHAAAQMYVDEVSPAEFADVILDNDDLAHPRLHPNRVHRRHPK